LQNLGNPPQKGCMAPKIKKAGKKKGKNEAKIQKEGKKLGLPPKKEKVLKEKGGNGKKKF